MLAAISIDVAVDGLLIGIGFATGVVEGRLLTLALSVEALFLGLSIIASCSERKLPPIKSFIVAASPGLILSLFALLGASILGTLHGAIHQAVVAFGLAALLYLVTEELLVEAHESPDEPIEVAGFFAGFLLILALALL
jgi:ZIP family zinc transporter